MTLRVALAGCGVVGGAFARLLDERRNEIAARYDVDVEVTSVLVRHPGKLRSVSLSSSLFTSDVSQFLSAPSDIGVEALGGLEPARGIAAAALGSGKRFVTANKELIAASGADLAAAAGAGGGALDFEAAVGGSVPVIRTVRDAIGGATPKSLRGILNGTSNFILSKLEERPDFDAALEAARAAGLAEADVSRDLDGRDSEAKLRILAWLAFGIDPSALVVRRAGLPADTVRLVEQAKAVGGRVRLVAECAAVGPGVITATVEPVIVEKFSSFGATRDEENRVEIDLGWGSPISVSGPGAGCPTAVSLLSDVLSSPAKRGRLRSTGAFTSVADTRPHRWLVTADACASSLLRASLDGTLDGDVGVRGGAVRAITHPVSHADLDERLSRIPSGGVVAARLSIADPRSRQ